MSPGSPTHHPKSYSPILPGHKEWPVVRLSQNRKSFIESVINETINRILRNGHKPQNLVEELEVTLFLERNRMRRNPWKVDPEDDDHLHFDSI